MTHDPFCPQAQMYQDDAVEWWDGCQEDFDCRCVLIAAVRADTLRRPDEHEFVSVRAMLGWAQQIREEERASILGEADGAENTVSPDSIPGDSIPGEIAHDPLCLCALYPCREEQRCYPEDCHCSCATLRRVRPIIEGQARAGNVAGNVAAVATFQHDPMCPWVDVWEMRQCPKCNLIAKVRADERVAAAKRVLSVSPEAYKYIEDDDRYKELVSVDEVYSCVLAGAPDPLLEGP